MRNRYDRPYIVIHEPIATARDQRTVRSKGFERKVATAEERGFVVVGSPSFTLVYVVTETSGTRRENPVMFGTVLMRQQGPNSGGTGRRKIRV